MNAGFGAARSQGRNEAAAQRDSHFSGCEEDDGAEGSLLGSVEEEEEEEKRATRRERDSVRDGEEEAIIF